MVFSSDQDGFVLSHGNVMPIPVQPKDAPALWETTIKGSALVVAPLRNESNDVVALATRVSWLDERTDFLMGGPQSQSSWILSYPGQGTLAIEQEESLWSIFRNGVISVWLLGQSYEGEKDLATTHGPALEGARILGGSGSLDGAAGILRQGYMIRQFSKDGVTFDSEVGLQVTLPENRAETSQAQNNN